MNNNVFVLYLLFKFIYMIVYLIIKNIKYYFEHTVLYSTLYILLNDEVFINMLD